MQLFVMRHAIAEEAAPGQEDAARELTDDGERKLRQVVKGLRQLDVDFERVLTSPWRRAARTAELLRPLCEEEAIVTDLLTRTPSSELLALIAERNETTVVVGHEPWLGELVAWLAFGDQRHGEALDFKKAGLMWLEGSAIPGGMTMRAMLPPGVVRKLRR